MAAVFPQSEQEERQRGWPGQKPPDGIRTLCLLPGSESPAPAHTQEQGLLTGVATRGLLLGATYRLPTTMGHSSLDFAVSKGCDVRNQE